ncbi:MAG: glycoside hydrolase family 97 catalytic domain-containing protein [Bacteroidota bacterium]|nr:glycoside hydrolase family 97 catalytic domain-containing protein [Bacteroidota bacterium]
MRNYLTTVLLLIAAAGIQAQTLVSGTLQTLSSPDGAYVCTCYQKETHQGLKQLFYTVNYKGRPVVLESALGVQIENKTVESALGIPNDTCTLWSENLLFTGSQRDQHDTVWTPVYGEHTSIRAHYNELTLQYRKGESLVPVIRDGYEKTKSYFMDVIIRAYNEGIAICYRFPEPTNGLFLHITGEQTQFTMPEGTQAYFEGWAQGPYSLVPLKDWKNQCERPLTMKLTNGLTVALAEARMTDYARMKFGLDGNKPNTLQAMIYGSVDVIPPYSTPWRVIMAGEKATDLIANKDLILNLNPDNQLADVSWIKPGKVIRVTKLTQADALKYVDFAAARGLQYIHLDAGWYGPEMKMSSSALKVGETRDLDIPALVKYASAKGIGVWLYVNQRALSTQLDSILPLYREWGIKGIKFGFVQVGNQYWTSWLHNAVRKCADYGLMVDIHDEYRPTGFSRTYPNLMTQEGIRGNEEMPDADHNATLPFTRFLAGPADYTICYYSNRIKTTHAHQLALSVVYYSPVQFLYWYDHPSQYKGEPEVEFFDKVKTVWDDSKVLNGEIGQYISVARRSGNDWFVGAITGKTTRTLPVPLSFLKPGQSYVASLYTDDSTLTTGTKVKITRMLVSSKSVLRFNLQNSGGCAVYLTPATKSDAAAYKVMTKKKVLF